MKPYLLIKDFGNNTEIDSVEMLAQSLSNYVGKHISIVKELQSGIKKTFFIFVKDETTLIDAYTKKRINLSEFNK